MADYQYRIKLNGEDKIMEIDAPADATEYYTVNCEQQELGFIYPEMETDGIVWKASEDKLIGVAQELGEFIAMANLKS